MDIFLDLFYVIGKVRDIKSLFTIFDISVGDEGDLDSKASILVPHVVDDLAQRVLGTLDPRVH